MLRRIVYRRGFAHRLDDVGDCPPSPSRQPRPPRGRARAPRPLLDLGGTYGDPQAGDPIQYDELRIEHDQGDVGIVVYNRAILLFFTDSEASRCSCSLTARRTRSLDEARPAAR